jgi:hypothetical protein
MGTRGPVPNRESDLARPRSRKGKEHAEPVTKGELRKVTVPTADSAWHPIARKLWDSLKTSGQADFYQNSDWAYAYSVCDDLSHFKKSGQRSSMMAQVIYSAMSNLLVTEADRRRVRIELHEPEAGEDEASVTAINNARAKLGLA